MSWNKSRLWFNWLWGKSRNLDYFMVVTLLYIVSSTNPELPIKPPSLNPYHPSHSGQFLHLLLGPIDQCLQGRIIFDIPKFPPGGRNRLWKFCKWSTSDHMDDNSHQTWSAAVSKSLVRLSYSPTISYTSRFNNNKQRHICWCRPTSTKARDIQNDDTLQGCRDIDLSMSGCWAPAHTDSYPIILHINAKQDELCMT